MKTIIAFVLGVMLTGAVAANAMEIISVEKISITPEIGYVVLTDPASESLENGLAFGVTPGYQLFKHVRAELPILASFHNGKNLPEGESAKMSMISFTPGLAFGTEGNLRFWFFGGFGGTFMNSEFKKDDLTAETKKLGFATNLRGGVDYAFMKNLSAGAALGVMSAAVEEEELNGSKDWKTNVYYTMTLRVGYTF